MFDFSGLYGVVSDTFGDDAVWTKQDIYTPQTIKVVYSIREKEINIDAEQTIFIQEHYVETTQHGIQEGDLLYINNKEFRCARVSTKDTGLTTIQLSPTEL